MTRPQETSWPPSTSQPLPSDSIDDTPYICSPRRSRLAWVIHESWRAVAVPTPVAARPPPSQPFEPEGNVDDPSDETLAAARILGYRRGGGAGAPLYRQRASQDRCHVHTDAQVRRHHQYACLLVPAAQLA